MSRVQIQNGQAETDHIVGERGQVSLFLPALLCVRVQPQTGQARERHLFFLLTRRPRSLRPGRLRWSVTACCGSCIELALGLGEISADALQVWSVELVTGRWIRLEMRERPRCCWSCWSCSD